MKLVPQFEAGQLTAETPVPNWWPIRRRLEIAHEWARTPVLDVGGGTGWLSLHLAEWGHDVTASDYSDDALANFEANLRITGRSIPITKQDVADLTYADEQFASLFCISVLSYVADLDRALTELHRVLMRGGIAVIGCINAFGAFAFMFDRDPRTLFRKTRYRGDIRQDPEHFHGPRWWQERLARRFTVRKVMPLEIFSPLIARLRGYDAPERWTRWDVRLAERAPKELASEVIFILQK